MTAPSFDIYSEKWKEIVQASADQQYASLLAYRKAEDERLSEWRAKQPPLTRRQKFRSTRYRVYAKVQRGREWLASKVAGYDVTDGGY
jgi:DNA repair photolyase